MGGRAFEVFCFVLFQCVILFVQHGAQWGMRSEDPQDRPTPALSRAQERGLQLSWYLWSRHCCHFLSDAKGSMIGLG